jgi:L-ribulose-5-phosphate 4-epimerase
LLEDLKNDVLKANLDLVNYGLVTLTWGNVSAIDRSEGLVVIKPSGVEYEAMTVRDIVVVDLEGKIVDGTLKPSSDTPTHIELYKAFPKIGSVTHTHSEMATVFAQACFEIPCYGTTHADYFYGSIPVTRFLKEEEVESDYEKNTGSIIVERFAQLDPEAIPGVLVAGHGPFSWGKDPSESVKTSLILENVAKMARSTLQLNPDLNPIPDYIITKHYKRKHGQNAYYGQQKTKDK